MVSITIEAKGRELSDIAESVKNLLVQKGVFYGDCAKIEKFYPENNKGPWYKITDQNAFSTRTLPVAWVTTAESGVNVTFYAEIPEKIVNDMYPAHKGKPL